MSFRGPDLGPEPQTIKTEAKQIRNTYEKNGNRVEEPWCFFLAPAMTADLLILDVY